MPLLVGGAALSEKFTTGKIAPAYSAPTFYAKDAMTGLRLMNEIMDPATRESEARAATYSEVAGLPERDMGEKVDAGTTRSSQGPHRYSRFHPSPYLDRRVRDVPQLAGDLGLHQSVHALRPAHGLQGQLREAACCSANRRRWTLFHQMEEVKEEAAQFMKVRAVWQFFEAERDGNSIQLFEPGGDRPVHTFHFGRQPRNDGLCLSDYILDPADGQRDHIALFVVTAGEGVREKSEAAKAAASSSRRTRSRRWRSRRRKAAPSGCTAVSARTGASPIRPT